MPLRLRRGPYFLRGGGIEGGGYVVCYREQILKSCEKMGTQGKTGREQGAPSETLAIGVFLKRLS